MLDVCLLGTGGMMPIPRRWLTSLMCRYNGSNILIDCGEGTQVAVKQKGWTFKPIDVICITHYHADHISGLPAGTDTAKTESKTAQAQMLILELLADGKRMPSAELEKAVNERGISSRTMRTAKSRIGDRLVTEKDGTAWVCYLRN